MRSNITKIWNFIWPWPKVPTDLENDDIENDENYQELWQCTINRITVESERLDKYTIGISGAAFTITMAFLEKIIYLNESRYLWVLWVSLICLSLCILVTIFNFFFVERSNIFHRNIIEKTLDENNKKIYEWYVNKQREKIDYRIYLINYIRLGLFFLGILLLIAFFMINNIKKYGWI